MWSPDEMLTAYDTFGRAAETRALKMIIDRQRNLFRFNARLVRVARRAIRGDLHQLLVREPRTWTDVFDPLAALEQWVERGR